MPPCMSLLVAINKHLNDVNHAALVMLQTSQDNNKSYSDWNKNNDNGRETDKLKNAHKKSTPDRRKREELSRQSHENKRSAKLPTTKNH